MIDTTKKWFVLNAGQVHGPLTAEEVEAEIPSLNEALIWGRGLGEWVPPMKWKSAMENLGSSLSEVLKVEEPHWKYRLENQEFGPLTYHEFIDALKKVKDYNVLEIFGEGFTGWREIYAVQKIVDELGITRRAHQRVPIMGTLQIETKTGQVQAKVVSISEGGLGVNDAPPLQIGEKFKATFKSPNLFSEISCTCEIVYIGGDGFTGVKFIQIPMESQASIVEYVNKFKNLGER